MRWVRCIRAAAAAALCACLPATAGQYSDLWWNPKESGWGVNVVQQLETAFVTLFVYDADGRPTWYVAPAASVYAYAAGGLPQFRGALYRTRGPWHGGPFDPKRVEVAPAGEVYLEVLEKNRMRVYYTADGVAVSKEVVRQTWDQPVVAGNYVGQFALRQVRPEAGAPFGVRDFPGDVLVHFDGGQGFMRVDDPLRRCEYRGAYETTGKLIRFTGAYTCSAGDGAEGTFTVEDLEISANGLTGYLRTWSGGLNQYGRFAALMR